MVLFKSSGKDTEKGVVIPSILFLLILYFMINTITKFNLGNVSSILNIIGSTILLIYFGGRLYGEFNISKDFIEVTTEGLRYRETPAFGMGWLPRNGGITFNAIGKVDLVEVQSFFHPEKKYSALSVRPKISGKQIILGSKLSKEQQINILLALKGSVTLSAAINKILGDNIDVGDTLKNVTDFAKNVWKRYQQEKK